MQSTVQHLKKMLSYSVLVFCSLLKFSLGGYDCIKNCTCASYDDLLVDCRDANYTVIPQWDYQYPFHILHFENNNVRRLRDGEFLHLKELKELYLQGNKIDTIEYGAFDGIQRLQKLDLSRNRLSAIPREDVKKLALSLIWLSISDNKFDGLPVGMSSLAMLAHLNISGNILISEIQAGSLPPNLEELCLSHTSITHIGRSALRNQQGLKLLEFANCVAGEPLDFDDDVFDEMTSLEQVDFSGCSCSRLPRNAFIKMTNLSRLALKNSSLNVFPQFYMQQEEEGSGGWSNSETYTFSSALNGSSTPSSVSSLKRIWFHDNLKALDLSNNPNIVFEEGEAHFSPTLTELRLGYMNITLVNEELFGDATSIEVLDLQFSDVMTISPGAFSSMRNLSQLWLSGNPIKVLPELPGSLGKLDVSGTALRTVTKGPLSRLDNLTEANFSSCLIEDVVEYSFGHMVSLKSLDLSGNRITILKKDVLSIGFFHSHHDAADTLKRHSSLAVLILSNGLISVIEPRAFQTQGQLKNLDIRGNFLTTLQPGTFIGLRSLVVLLLNKNSIVDIAPAAFAELHKLEILHLDDNKMEIIYEGIFADMDSLRELHLQRNDLGRVHSAAIVTLQYLDMSNNKLGTLPKLGGYNLRVINASKNLIVDFEPDAMHNLTKLKSLNVSYCKLKHVDYRMFQNAQALEILDLTGNKISNFLDKKLASLKHLYLRNNSIRSVDPGPILRNVAPKIETLDLSLNKINNLDPVFFRGLLALKVNFSRNNFLCDCTLAPMVNWIKNNTRIKNKYTCGSPPDKYLVPVVKAVSDLKCNDDTTKVGPSKATLFTSVLVSALLALVILILLIWCGCKRLKKQHSDHVVGLDGGVRMVQVRDPVCGICCFGNAYTRSRGRFESEESRDLVEHVTSPIDKEAPIPL